MINLGQRDRVRSIADAHVLLIGTGNHDTPPGGDRLAAGSGDPNISWLFRSFTTVKSQAARGLETLRTLVAHPVTAD